MPTSSTSVRKSVVSYNVAEVAALVDRAVDVLWPSRYDTKSWDTLRPEPLTSVGADSSVEARSQAAYQRLVFDITAQAVTALCDDTSTRDTSQPWRQQRTMTISSRPFPQSADQAQPLIKALVLQHLGLESHRPLLLPRCLEQVRGRRQTDQVEKVLGVEIVEEELEWTDYSDDELFVKMQLTDMLFDMIVSDTVNMMASVVVRKRQRFH